MVKRVIRAPELSVEARALWLMVESFGDINGENAHPSMALLARECQHDIKWVEKYMAELRSKEWISSHTMLGGRVNVYHLHTPEIRAYIPPEIGPMVYPRKTGVAIPPKNGPLSGNIDRKPRHPPKAISENITLNGKKKKRPHLPKTQSSTPEPTAHDSDDQPTESRDPR